MEISSTTSMKPILFLLASQGGGFVEVYTLLPFRFTHRWGFTLGAGFHTHPFYLKQFSGRTLTPG